MTKTEYQATLTCTENAGLNCTGDAQMKGEYNVVVAVKTMEVTTHELQEKKMENTKSKCGKPSSWIRNNSRPSQDIELHNAKLLRGSQLDNLDEANLSLVPTNNTVKTRILLPKL